MYVLNNYATSLNMAWMVLGDFNIVLGAHKKIGLAHLWIA